MHQRRRVKACHRIRLLSSIWVFSSHSVSARRLFSWPSLAGLMRYWAGWSSQKGWQALVRLTQCPLLQIVCSQRISAVVVVDYYSHQTPLSGLHKLDVASSGLLDPFQYFFMLFRPSPNICSFLPVDRSSIRGGIVLPYSVEVGEDTVDASSSFGANQSWPTSLMRYSTSSFAACASLPLQ